MSSSGRIGCDALVIGGGMAGVSVAYELARDLDVVLVEREPNLAHHSTGRSAALLAPSYGPLAVRRITAASKPEHDRIGQELGHGPVLTPREVLWIAAREDEAALERHLAALEAPDLGERISVADAVTRFPPLRPSRVGAAAVEFGTFDIDVARLHQAYVRGLRARKGEIWRGAGVDSIAALGNGAARWRVTTRNRVIDADVVVNAAGAWADEVAKMAGARPVGLTPLRRTLFTSPIDSWHSTETWPFLIEVNEQFYCRPEAGGLLVSPADATPSEPCDAKADPLYVARAIDIVNEYTSLSLRSVSAAWAGLRTFAADGLPVVGVREGEGGFVWSAGQGGYGIQMAPALARITAATVFGEPPPVDGVRPAELSPDRFAPA